MQRLPRLWKTTQHCCFCVWGAHSLSTSGVRSPRRASAARVEKIEQLAAMQDVVHKVPDRAAMQVNAVLAPYPLGCCHTGSLGWTPTKSLGCTARSSAAAIFSRTAQGGSKRLMQCLRHALLLQMPWRAACASGNGGAPGTVGQHGRPHLSAPPCAGGHQGRCAEHTQPPPWRRRCQGTPARQ